MAELLSAPLTPPGCDLRAQQWMKFPLCIVNSRFWRTASRDVRAISFELWCAAWYQVPAASLPDDDTELAQMAGFGAEVDAWRVFRLAVLSPWTKCTDGQLYHPTLAEVANEAWLEALLERCVDAVRRRQSAAPIARDMAAALALMPPQRSSLRRRAEWWLARTDQCALLDDPTARRIEAGRAALRALDDRVQRP